MADRYRRSDRAQLFTLIFILLAIAVLVFCYFLYQDLMP